MILESINNNLKHKIHLYSKIAQIYTTSQTLSQPLYSPNQIWRPQLQTPNSLSQ